MMLRPYKLILIAFLPLLLILVAGAYNEKLSWKWVGLTLIILFAIFYLGVTQIQWNFFFSSFNSGSKDKKVIALTFDDGIHANTSKILSVLQKEEVAAAFFLIGKNVIGQESIVLQMHEQDHLIANHSYNHGFHFDWQSSALMAKELEHCNATIYKVIGKMPKLMRPPYGICNPNLAEAIKQTNMHSIGWNLRSFDTQIKDEHRLTHRVVKRLKNGSIILLHDSEPVTVNALTNIIREARQQGYTFERLDKLLQIDAYA